jgi:alpha-1,6-mannosyltransferase
MRVDKPKELLCRPLNLLSMLWLRPHPPGEEHHPTDQRDRRGVLAVIGLLGVILFGVEIWAIIEDRHRHFLLLLSAILISGIPFCIALWWTFRIRQFPRGSVALIVGGGILFRAVLLPLNPVLLSTDIYRYIWDGRVQGAGINPYVYIPVDRRLETLRDASIYPNINRRNYAHTIYPPAAQIFFFVITRITQSVSGFKVAILLLEVGTMILILLTLGTISQPPQRVLAYAWHPLPIWEFGLSGHIDALMILCIALALYARCRGRFAVVGFALGLATLVKFMPALLFPALYRRWDKKMPVTFTVTLLILYLPYIVTAGPRVLGFLPQYLREEGLTNGGRYYLLDLSDRILDLLGVVHGIPPAVFTALALAALGIAMVWAFLRNPSLSVSRPDQHLRWLCSGFVLALLFSVILSSYYPWYCAWVVLFLCFVPNVAGLGLTLSLTQLYRSLIEQSGDDLFRFQSRAFLPFFGLLLASGWLAWQRHRRSISLR